METLHSVILMRKEIMTYINVSSYQYCIVFSVTPSLHVPSQQTLIDNLTLFKSTKQVFIFLIRLN